MTCESRKMSPWSQKPAQLVIYTLCCLLIGLPMALFSDDAAAARCGDGIMEYPEECDNGQENSDSMPNACRSNCVSAHCGDGVTDQGEQCDDGYQNNDQIPGACRRSCRTAYCGDGVVDLALGEQCDTGGAVVEGCKQCRTCYEPRNDLFISADAELCPGRYFVNDEGIEGVIIVNGQDMTLDCNGAELISGSKGNGTGIRVDGANVVLHDCILRQFATGIRLNASGAILYRNDACHNTMDIASYQAGNSGVGNSCNKLHDWQENGRAACTKVCTASAMALPSSRAETAINKGTLTPSPRTPVGSAQPAHVPGKVPMKSQARLSAPAVKAYLAAPKLLSPAHGTVFSHFPRKTTVTWGSVSGAASYTLEIEYCEAQDCKTSGKLMKRQQGLKATSYTFNFVGAQPGRWRVWAVDAKGQVGRRSPWFEFRYTR